MQDSPSPKKRWLQVLGALILPLVLVLISHIAMSSPLVSTKLVVTPLILALIAVPFCAIYAGTRLVFPVKPGHSRLRANITALALSGCFLFVMITFLLPFACGRI